MYCKACGKELTERQTFCPNCGQKNEVLRAPVPEQTIPSQPDPGMNMAMNNPAPVSYVPTRQVPPNEMAPNQMAPNQMAPNPMQPNQMAPNQMAPNPMQPNQMAPNQMPPNPMQPNQMAPNQVPPRPMQPNQVPIYQMPNGQMPPMNPYTPYSAPKKKNILLPILLAVFGVIVIVLGVIAVVNVFGKMKAKVDNSIESIDTIEDLEVDDSDQPVSISDDESSNDDSTSNTAEDITYAEVYGYSDLPGVISIDSDSRFTYITNYAYNGVSSYTYMYNDIGSTESEFYYAVDDYCTLLQTRYGYYYEEEFSEQQYTDTGEVTEYLSKDNICLGVTASIEEDGNYVYVAIYTLSDEADGSASNYSFENYVEYVEGRSSQAYYQSTEVYLENGMAFRLYDVIVTDQGDGTALLEANIDLGALNSDWYFYPDDFMVLPKDSEGYILSDLCGIESVTDSLGYTMSMPFLLDTEYYYSYKVSFIVPAETTDFTIYATNVTSSGDDFAGPVYYIDMELE